MNDQITIKNLEVYANHGVFRKSKSWDRNSSFLPSFIQIQEKLEKRMIWKLPLTMEPSARPSPAS